MPEPTPPRRPLATFLRPAAVAADPHAGAAPPDDAAQTVDAADAELTAASATDAQTAQIDAVAAAGDETAADPVEIPATAPVHDTARLAAGSETPSEPGFVHAPAVGLRAPRWQWATVLALALLLLLQIALADRARLAADAATRPWIATLCAALGCSLPAWHEPAAFTMTSRDVRPVPGQAGALQVQASIRNDARWAQQWPTLRLSLSDADGRVIGTGVFDASDYLGQEAPTASALEPGQSAQIAFQVREPAASTVAFNFEFL